VRELYYNSRQSEYRSFLLGLKKNLIQNCKKYIINANLKRAIVMNSKGFSKELDKRLSEIADGTPIVASDFSDIANVRTIRELLNTRIRNGTMRRIIPGIYVIPKTNKLLNIEVPVTPDALAQAIARNHNWTIAPSEQTALNALGLSTQVPAAWKYISDGPYTSYELDGSVIQFKHTTNKNISSMSPTSRLIVQALKALGKDELTGEALAKIAARLTKEDTNRLIDDTSRTTAWIRDAIREISKMKGGLV